MKALDMLKRQYAFFYRTVRANLDGLTAEESLIQPSPGGNCANWILGHVVGAHNAVMSLAGTEPVWESAALERASSRSDPITSANDALDWDAMVVRLLASEARLLAALDALGDADLDEEGFTDPFGNAATRGDMLNLLAVHQNYHAGQLAMCRRFAGYEGAIRGPELRKA